MLITDIVEAQEWVKFKGNSSSRVWFNTNTGQAFTANDDGNHSVSVVKNKDLFGVSDQHLAQVGVNPNEAIGDYDGRVLWAAMQRGWVRIYVDARSPDISSNIEATNLGFARRGLIWYSEQVGTPKRIVIVLRTGPGDKEGTGHPLRDSEQIEWFIRRGTFPKERVEPDTSTQMRQGINTTPHAFKNVDVNAP